jgi:hypothetical protein
VELASVIVRFVAEERIRKVERDGTVEEVTETVSKPVYEERIAGTFALAAVDIHEAGGRKLGGDEALKRLAQGSVVVVSADGQPVAAEYLRCLAKETVVIVPPALGTSGTGPAGRQPASPRNR